MVAEVLDRSILAAAAGFSRALPVSRNHVVVAAERDRYVDPAMFEVNGGSSRGSECIFLRLRAVL